MPTVSSRAERSPDRREADDFLALAGQVFDRFRPDVLLTYGGHPASLKPRRRVAEERLGAFYRRVSGEGTSCPSPAGRRWPERPDEGRGASRVAHSVPLITVSKRSCGSDNQEEWRRARNPAFGAASSRRAPAQVRQVVYAQTRGGFAQERPAGGEEPAQQSARGQLLQSRLPALGIVAGWEEASALLYQLHAQARLRAFVAHGRVSAHGVERTDFNSPLALRDYRDQRKLPDCGSGVVLGCRQRRILYLLPGDLPLLVSDQLHQESYTASRLGNCRS